jgi:hypothetical protein
MMIEGLNGKMELDQEAVTITHKGIMGFLTTGLPGLGEYF